MPALSDIATAPYDIDAGPTSAADTTPVISADVDHPRLDDRIASFRSKVGLRKVGSHRFMPRAKTKALPGDHHEIQHL